MVTDISGAFSQADVEDEVYIIIEGTMADLLAKIKPELYRKYIVMKNGDVVLYVKLRKVLYDLLDSGLTWWKNSASFFRKLGFKLNPYDSCVAYKIIEGSTCTIISYIKDLII